MPRTRRSKKEILTAQLHDLDEKIDVCQSKIDAYRSAQAEIQKELDDIALAESKAAQEEALKELMVLMKEKGLTAEELKELI